MVSYRPILVRLASIIVETVSSPTIVRIPHASWLQSNLGSDHAVLPASIVITVPVMLRALSLIR